MIDERIKAYGREPMAAGRAIISALAVTGLYVFSAKAGRVDLFDVIYLLLLASTGFGFGLFYRARGHREFLRREDVQEAIPHEVYETHPAKTPHGCRPRMARGPCSLPLGERKLAG